MRIALLAVFPLHIIPQFEKYQPKGHFATWLPQLVEAFGRQNEFEIHWVFTSKVVPPGPPVRWLGQTFHCLHAPQRLRMFRGYRSDCRLVRQRLDEIQPDLVHAWGTEDYCGLAAVLSGRPWLLSMQGILTEYVQRVRMHPFVRLQAFYERYVLKRALEITVESRWGESIVAPLAPAARLHLVEYGVHERFYKQPWEPDPARPVAIFVGTHGDERKGLHDAIAAFQDPRLAAAELHVIGTASGSYVERLHRVAPANVRWRGNLSRDETAQAMGRAWCLVLPTRADTSPNVVKEARVIGLPVVTTPEGGQSDYIAEGVNGFLAAPGDVAKLADGLAALLGDLDRTRAMGAARWQEQREFFRPEHTAERFQALYRMLASEAAAKA